MTASRLDALEVASGLVLGTDGAPPTARAGTAPLEALEAAIRPALARPPCLVSFSGGRDSSAILAAAAALARREGLPLPIPATNRFSAVAEAGESDWQDRVVRWVRVDDWLRLDFADELDCVGPVATGALRRHGLLYPCNAHFHLPLLAAAAGGSLLTGIGGDEMFGTRGRAALVASGAARPVPRDVLRLGLALSPRPIRRNVLRRRSTPLPWLRREAEREVARRWADFAAGEPLRWSAHVRWCSRSRSLRLGLESLDLLAADERVHLVHPFADPTFLAALASWRSVPADRTAATKALFGALLPTPVATRATKASFDGAFFSTYSREFTEGWNGGGADAGLVDVDWLRENWRSEAPAAQTFLQLQAAWLAGSDGEAREQRLDVALEPVPAGGTPELERR